MKRFYSRFAVISAAICLAASAQAGGPDTASLTDAAFTQSTQTALSPAEIRNAVQREVDRLSQSGLDIDPADFDGIGLTAANEAEVIERMSYAVDTMILDPDWIGSTEVETATEA